ncbi:MULTISPECIES: glycosyltransferase family 2 protein [Halorussus]|uniref:glycosyltransferase family 2 protein n=1 Tax=Halorussus TaxID=1070314 RepID=UPI00209DF9E3|nr:glycosyltransferase family 2 protein [Halorussus vallis]USZ77310.1 glycosyltransferase family 2 protein [Halorussus vallis]
MGEDGSTPTDGATRPSDAAAGAEDRTDEDETPPENRRETTDRPTVSVVVPTYYRNDRLRAALSSVADQTYRPVELLVVDGSGEAHARPVVGDFAGEVADDSYFEWTYVPQKRDRGPQAARSLGVDRAAGSYVQLLDDDDRLRPGKFAAQVPRLEAEDDVGVVYCALADEEWGEIRPDDPIRGDALERALRIDTFPAIPSSMLIDAGVLADLLPLGNRHGADDSGTKIELARRTEFDYVDEVLVERGKPDDPLSSSWAHVEGRKRLVEKYADLYERFPPDVRATAVRQTYYRQGRKHLEEKPWSAAAVASLALAAYHTPEDRPEYVRDAAAAVFGRPGMAVADALG